MLKKNMGSIDRILRFAVGAAALIAFFMLPEASYRYWLLLGIIPFGTSLLGSCPLYTIFGIGTCKMKSE